MDKKMKKLNGSMIVAIVLSVLLIMSLTAGGTLAWFSSRDTGTRDLTMGDAIVVTMSDADDSHTYRQGSGTLPMVLPVDDRYGITPGMKITPNLKIQLQGSTTNALLRARFITSVEFPDNFVEAAYVDTIKYPDKAQTGDNNGKNYVTTTGRVLDATAFPNDHVYAGKIYYDYYNSDGKKITPDGTVIPDDATDDAAHSVTVKLLRVKVRPEIYQAIAAGSNFLGVAVTEANAAELEIRQRGLDLTDMINKALTGGNGATVQSRDSMRRVADGWAYREADKAWYYLGSKTNGYVLANQTGVSEDLDTTKDVARDITTYKKIEATASKPEYYTPVYTQLAAPATGKPDNSRNFLGATASASDPTISKEDNEIGVMSQDTMASIQLYSETVDADGNVTDFKTNNVSIDFLTKPFSIPSSITNELAKAKVKFTFTVEAVQDYLVDTVQEALGNAERIPNNLANAILVFNNAFPAKTIDGTGLEATGIYYNVIPGAPLQTEAEKTAAENLCAACPNKGYGETTDAHGVKIAKYTVTDAAYVLGTASSLGVQPLSGTKVTIAPTPAP